MENLNGKGRSPRIFLGFSEALAMAVGKRRIIKSVAFTTIGSTPGVIWLANTGTAYPLLIIALGSPRPDQT
jgi:hypothetical protein